MLCGGCSEEQAAHEELQNIVDSVRSDCEKRSGEKFSEFTATKFRSQVVAGTNYFVKVRVDEGKFIHLRIFVPLPYTGEPPQLADFKVGKSEADPIEYF